jgi:hypothetical protein
MAITITIDGDKALAAKLRQLGDQVVKVIGQFLAKKANDIRDQSVRQVPVDQGPLRSSAQVKGPTMRGGRLKVTVGYGNNAVKYALSVHENPRAGRTGGWPPKRVEPHWVTIKGRSVLIGGQRKHWATTGKWKYLEDPFNAQTGRLYEDLAQVIERAFRSMGK